MNTQTEPAPLDEEDRTLPIDEHMFHCHGCGAALPTETVRTAGHTCPKGAK